MLIILDAAGGVLSSVGAALARAAGFEARAATTTPVADPPDEVRTALSEVGISEPAEVVKFEPSDGDQVLYVGSSLPDEELDAGDSIWVWVQAGLYQGPAETEFGDTSLERLSCARILRDRLERAIERAASD